LAYIIIKKNRDMNGDLVRKITSKQKRYCFALDLKNDKKLIEEYVKYHRPENGWKEINDGIKNSGIEVMDIYLADNRLFMICELDSDLDINDAWAKMDTGERQDEWASLMSKFQQALPGHDLGWVRMSKIYSIPD